MGSTREAGGTTVGDIRAFALRGEEGGEDCGTGVDPARFERELRGKLFQELDLLAFALEMEASEALERGDEEGALRTQQTRLGIRLAQRLIGAVPAPEVDRRLDRWRSTYLAKFPF